MVYQMRLTHAQGAHWWVDDNKIKVGMNPLPSVMPVANVHPKKWQDYKPNPDLATGRRCIDMLSDAGFEVEGDTERIWMIDVFPLLVGMFPDGCPPTTVISLNSHFDPFYHARIGTVLRPLREEGYLFIGSGGGVHNLYRTEWKYMNKYKDNFAMEKPPDPENLEFRTALEDVIVKTGGGPKLKRGLARLMKHPYFRDAHGTDEHYIPALFVAGAIGEEEDEAAQGVLGAECWELVSLLPEPWSEDLYSRRFRGIKEKPNSRLVSGPRGNTTEDGNDQIAVS